MKILKNIFFPIVIIIVSTTFVTNYPNIKIGIIINLFLVIAIFGSSILSYYYIFCNMFPDKRNTDIPPQFMPRHQQELSNAKYTKASRLAGYFSLVTIALGLFIWYYLPLKYQERELKIYGLKTTSTIINSIFSKQYTGEKKIYVYKDKLGNTYSGFLIDNNIKIGDTIDIVYSSERPEINCATPRQ